MNALIKQTRIRETTKIKINKTKETSLNMGEEETPLWPLVPQRSRMREYLKILP